MEAYKQAAKSLKKAFEESMSILVEKATAFVGMESTLSAEERKFATKIKWRLLEAMETNEASEVVEFSLIDEDGTIDVSFDQKDEDFAFRKTTLVRQNAHSTFKVDSSDDLPRTPEFKGVPPIPENPRKRKRSEDDVGAPTKDIKPRRLAFD
ncbi:Oidioi.mRNA.OKI2018_I69.chr1.g795.t1.cds [Oikopleura dioica]|uniref:Oidioi.mRNA.OKI2018_I69.chr1.g795.t1.cds n=1 Tax=Oikopleura dioica TaxID=34765 RepID=A0ABN7SR51_OIKDI|nr:Oidioi.mRNA.OKI2018_I69.chr1.g795.t1.cds [Oikopleura dioica]